MNLDDPTIQFGTFPNEYLLQRVLAIHPTTPFREKRTIAIINGHGDVINKHMNYLILIPIVLKANTKIYASLPQFVRKNDLVYVNEIMTALEIEDSRRRLDRFTTHNEEDIPYTIADEIDISDADSIPQCRGQLFEDYFEKQIRIQEWIDGSGFSLK